MPPTSDVAWRPSGAKRPIRRWVIAAAAVVTVIAWFLSGAPREPDMKLPRRYDAVQRRPRFRPESRAHPRISSRSVSSTRRRNRMSASTTSRLGRYPRAGAGRLSGAAARNAGDRLSLSSRRRWLRRGSGCRRCRLRGADGRRSEAQPIAEEHDGARCDESQHEEAPNGEMPLRCGTTLRSTIAPSDPTATSLSMTSAISLSWVARSDIEPPRAWFCSARADARHGSEQREAQDEQHRQDADGDPQLRPAAGERLDAGVGDEAEGDAVGDGEGERHRDDRSPPPGRYSVGSSKSMSFAAAIIRQPTKISAGAVAKAGIDAASGAKNSVAGTAPRPSPPRARCARRRSRPAALSM